MPKIQKPTLSSVLADMKPIGGVSQGTDFTPLWKGPEAEGVTQSMLWSILGCPERAYVKYLMGLRPAPTFKATTDYGHLWHACEEGLAEFGEDLNDKGIPYWMEKLENQKQKFLVKFPYQHPEIQKWHRVCLMQFPIYVEWWKDHEDVTARTPMMQEAVFNVPYRLPSGRVVWLRGKFDSVDLIGNAKTGSVYLQENKTKGGPDGDKIQRQLRFDLQTGFYLTALHLLQKYSTKGVEFDCETETILPEDNHLGNMIGFDRPIAGVRYNVIRRPLSGGKGSIRQHQPTKSNPLGESEDQFYARLRNDYLAKEPESYFQRWKVEVSKNDAERYQNEFLIPKLESVCDWYEWVTSGDRFRPGNKLHYRHPYGGWNVLDEGGSSDLDEYLASGSTVGLTPVDELFTELKVEGE